MSSDLTTDDLPADLPPEKRDSIERVRALSTVMDDAIRVPGTDYRFGLDPVLGLLPVGGDALSAVISLYIVLEGYLMGVPQDKLARMVGNVVLDAVVGSIPVLGTLFDAFWKANVRNANLLEEHVEQYA
ncbi:DUF4112 domain-containing protein [Halomicrococcus sp. SG-WS-1]|uniref:DUF4112 domain-containing protein n=1 Tax=Halomicrococcus sp. SG-WS-1 TaxID=3439057 RepID=UPI003F791A3A